MVVSTPAIAQRDSASTVAPSAAAQYVGREVAVRGRVAQVSTSRSGTTFINFDRPFPNHSFSAVIFASAAAKFPTAKDWEGKTIEVRGKVQMYQGKPEIVLNSADQVRVVPDSPP